jgi:hypothetical protein
MSYDTFGITCLTKNRINGFTCLKKGDFNYITGITFLKAGDSSPYKTYCQYQLLTAGDTERASVHAFLIVSILKKGDFKYIIVGVTFLKEGVQQRVTPIECHAY